MISVKSPSIPMKISVRILLPVIDKGLSYRVVELGKFLAYPGTPSLFPGKDLEKVLDVVYTQYNWGGELIPLCKKAYLNGFAWAFLFSAFDFIFIMNVFCQNRSSIDIDVVSFPMRNSHLCVSCGGQFLFQGLIRIQNQITYPLPASTKRNVSGLWREGIKNILFE